MKKKVLEKSSYEWGIAWMLLSAACLSVSFLFLKINLAYIDYYFLIFLRFFIPFLFVLLIFMISWNWKILVSSKNIWLQISRCLCVLVSQYAIAYFISQSTLLNATVLLNSSPLFIPFIEWIFLGQKPGKSTLIGALIAFFGVILVLHPDKSLFTPLSLIGLIAALGQAGSQVLYGLKSKSENLISTLFYLYFFTTLFSACVFFFISSPQISSGTSQKSIFMWFVIVNILSMGVATLLNQYFRGLAYRCGRPSTLAVFLYFSVFVSALFDWVIFKNYPTPITIIGSCLIILGGVLKVFLRSRILRKNKK